MDITTDTRWPVAIDKSGLVAETFRFINVNMLDRWCPQRTYWRTRTRMTKGTEDSTQRVWVGRVGGAEDVLRVPVAIFLLGGRIFWDGGSRQG